MDLIKVHGDISSGHSHACSWCITDTYCAILKHFLCLKVRYSSLYILVYVQSQINTISNVSLLYNFADYLSFIFIFAYRQDLYLSFISTY